MKHRLENIKLRFTKFKDGQDQYEGINVRATTSVEARYAKTPGYEDNPDICALPAMKKYSSLKEDFTSLPRYYSREDIEKMNGYERRRGLRSLFELYSPLGHTFDLYEEIYKCLFNSYSLRELWKSDEDGAIESLQINEFGRAPFLLLLGVTGSGKTVSARQVFSIMPMSIRHTFNNKEYIQIPILFVTVSVGNLSGVLLAIALKVDDITDMGNYHREQMRRARVGEGCSILTDWIRTYHIGLICIDECQFMDFGKGKTSIENLISVSADTGCSICLIGNYEVRTKMQKYSRLLSRIGDNILEAKCTTESDRRLLSNLIDKLWKYNWMENEVPLTKSLSDAIMSESMYNVAVMKNLVIMIQYEAIFEWPEDGITPDYVREVARKHFPDLQMALYRDTPEGDRKLMEMLDDHKRLLDESLKEDEEKMKEEASISTGKDSILPENLRKFENAYDMLLDDDFLKTDVERAFRLAMKNNAGLQFLSSMEIYDAVLKKLTKSQKKKNH